MRSVVRFVLGLSVLCMALRPAYGQSKADAGDWPGWRGANRDNISKETGLLKSWPKEGPTLAWKVTGLGRGYSTPSVAKGVLYVMGTEENDMDSVIALDTKDGTQLWSTPIAKGAGGGGYPGPRSTPSIDADALYALSSAGVLVSASVKSGQIQWQKNLVKEFGGRVGGWAYCESPLIDGDALICTPGGDTASIVALNKKTGDVIWKSDMSALPNNRGKKGSNYTNAEYSSVIVATLQGVKQYVQFLRGGVVGIDAATGTLLWNYDRPASGTANITTPLQFGDAIFASSDYSKPGGGLVNIVKKDGQFEAEEVYFLDVLRNRHGGQVLVDGYLYATNDQNLLCVDVKDGTIAWKNKSVGKGSVTYADGHIYVRSERGAVALVEANPKEYKETGRFNQPERNREAAWAHPVVAGGKLYLMDQDLCFCYDIKEK